MSKTNTASKTRPPAESEKKSLASADVKRVAAADKSPEAKNDGESTLARLLVADGLITQKQLEHGQRIVAKLGREATVLSVLKQMGLVDEEQICEICKNHRFELPLGDLLMELGYITRAELRVALKVQQTAEKGQKLGEILVKKRVIKEKDLARILASQIGMDYLEPEAGKCDDEWVDRISPDICNKYGFFPVAEEGSTLVVAFADPLSEEGQRTAAKVFQRDIKPVVATASSIRAAAAALGRRQKGKSSEAVRKIDDSSPQGLVDSMIRAGVSQGSSDLHIEPLKDRVRVRFRIDGVLREHAEFSHDKLQGVVSRLKVLAEADISERRRHQDGRILFEDPTSGAVYDMRASFYITVHGEAVVLRVLNNNNTVLDMSQLGMAPSMQERFRYQGLDSPSGVIIVTGPTGSGKTTTLYSCVNHLNNETTSIITAEDPVEYVVDGISQCSLNNKLGLTFEESLRHMVRQDPDVIVLGEIRDAFSAESAIQAALTGHKVLTTFHTEDSIGGLLRLLNMDIEAFLISSTVVCVVAQRLIRRVCQDCSTPLEPEPRDLQLLGWSTSDATGGEFCVGSGCETCHYTGYKGRVAVFELLVLTEAVRDAILARRTSAQIRQISVETSGLVTLLEDGLVKAARGETTLEEVRRTLPRLASPRPLTELRRLTGTQA
ncbi:MAG: ATPase, T2SS/T4P/T4SS family [Pseudomonadota bacterium]